MLTVCSLRRVMSSYVDGMLIFVREGAIRNTRLLLSQQLFGNTATKFLANALEPTRTSLRQRNN